MIINKNSQKTISKEHRLCKSTFSKARGLMFSKQKTLVFEFKKEQIVSLHMFFVFFKIDVIFVDKDKKVVELKENFRPFTFYKPKNKAKFVIEAKAGTILQTKTKVGDEIKIS